LAQDCQARVACFAPVSRAALVSRPHQCPAMLLSFLLTVTHPLTTICWVFGTWAAEAYYPNGHTQLLKLIFSSSPTTSLVVEGRRLADEETIDTDTIQAATIVTLIVAILIPVIIWLIFALMYKSSITDKRPTFTGGGPAQLAMLQPGKICDCWSDLHLCLHSCCCLEARAADTFQTAELAGYWAVVLAFFLEWAVAQAIGFVFNVYIYSGTRQNSPGEGIGWIIASFLMSFYLSSRRSTYFSKFGGQSNFPVDVICYWWCQPCMFAQDGMALDKAQGVHVECCCKMVQTGQPTQAGTPPVVGVVTGVKASDQA